LTFEQKLNDQYSYDINASATPLIDQASRFEGYKGILGVGAGFTMKFFDKIYTQGHSISASGMLNTFEYNTDQSPNPDYFYTYKFINGVKVFTNYSLTYSFGARMTRYLDGFLGYKYSNTLAVSRTWTDWRVSLSYENGGFTDDGTISMWYVDQYRRLITMGVRYTF
jgi:hypothetical protein